MLDSFLTFINQHTPDLKQHPTLLAVSGGVDSVVMADLFHRMGFPAGIAHCNFRLRGGESDEDEAFVRALAERYNFPFFVTWPDVKELVGSAPMSTQMAARKLRYEWFEKIRKEFGYDWIATAHHANDSLETLLLNLARGTGLPGLCGIAPVNGNLVRPLLFSNRGEIGRYATENGVLWREDRTNQTDDYNRNKIRHRVIPVLSELNPSLEATFNTSSERLRAANALLDDYLQKWKSSAVEMDGELLRIPIDQICDRNEPIYRLWSILQDYGFQYSQVNGVVSALKGVPGKKFMSPSHVLLVDRDYIILRPALQASVEDEVAIEGPTGVFEWQGRQLTFRLSTTHPLHFDKTTIAVDADLLTFPLKVRKWQQGDSFRPFGMSGKSKKVSDLLIDNKIDRFQKERTGVLLDGAGEIVWVVGVRADERFRVGESAERILLISLSETEE